MSMGPGTEQAFRRGLQLVAGLGLFGFSVGLMISAGLGVDPWDVFHQGVAEISGLSVGTVVIATSVVVLLLWIPLRQRPGIGTLTNVVLVGLALDLSLLMLPTQTGWAARVLFLVSGIVLNGVATGLYIGAALGPGPRDGLMTGLARRGHSIREARTSIEIGVLAIGWLLGGTVGIGTVLYALSIGTFAQFFIQRFTIEPVQRKELHTPCLAYR